MTGVDPVSDPVPISRDIESIMETVEKNVTLRRLLFTLFKENPSYTDFGLPVLLENPEADRKFLTPSVKDILEEYKFSEYLSIALSSFRHIIHLQSVVYMGDGSYEYGYGNARLSSSGILLGVCGSASPFLGQPGSLVWNNFTSKKFGIQLGAGWESSHIAASDNTVLTVRNGAAHVNSFIGSGDPSLPWMYSGRGKTVGKGWKFRHIAITSNIVNYDSIFKKKYIYAIDYSGSLYCGELNDTNINFYLVDQHEKYLRIRKFIGSDGHTFFAIDDNGTLLSYRSNPNSSYHVYLKHQPIASGWGKYVHVVAGGEGPAYAMGHVFYVVDREYKLWRIYLTGSLTQPVWSEKELLATTGW